MEVQIVGRPCDPVNVELTAADVERIPRENLRVPRDEFVAVWQLAERMSDGNWYAIGVAETCRWIACTNVVFNYPHGPKAEPARSPVTGTPRSAHPELIERECASADLRLARNPNGIERRPGWLEAVTATLDWAWRGSDRPPLEISQAATG